MFKEQYEKLVAKFGKRNVTIGAVIVGVVVVGLILNGIGNKASEEAAERAIEAATGGRVDVDADDGEVTVRTEEGTWSTSAELPDDFPSDVPLYPDAEVQGSVAAAGQQGGGISVGLQTDDDLSDVTAWYKREVPAKGWTVTTDATVNGALILGASKDGRTLSVSVSGEGESVTIVLSVSSQ